VPPSRLLAATLAVVTLLPLTGTAAYAEPSADEIEARIEELWEQSEPLIEQYNLVHEQYEQNLAQQAQLTAQIQPLADQLADARSVVGRISAQAYMGGHTDAFEAMLAAGDDSDAFIDRLGYLESMAHAQTVRLSDVLALKAQFDEQKAPIDALVAQLGEQDTQLAAQEAEIENRLAELDQLRSQVLGSEQGTSAIKPWPCPAEYRPTPGYAAAKFACDQIGKSYVFGAAGPNTYDCSGLTQKAWQQVDVYLPHNAAAQRRSMPYVDRDELEIGDLIFVYSDLHHVAIYVGDGKAVHAPRSGDVVRMVSVDRWGSKIHSYGRP
jgi:hypothetical protein